MEIQRLEAEIEREKRVLYQASSELDAARQWGTDQRIRDARRALIESNARLLTLERQLVLHKELIRRLKITRWGYK